MIRSSTAASSDNIHEPFCCHFAYLSGHFFRLFLAGLLDFLDDGSVLQLAFIKACAEIPITDSLVYSKHLCECPLVVKLVVVLDECDEL